MKDCCKYYLGEQQIPQKCPKCSNDLSIATNTYKRPQYTPKSDKINELPFINPRYTIEFDMLAIMMEQRQKINELIRKIGDMP